MQIEVLKLVPRPPYRIDTYDVFKSSVFGAMPRQPIDDYFLVEGDGIVTLRPAYGVVRVEGMTTEEATDVVTRLPAKRFYSVRRSRSLSRCPSAQQITGIYVVQPDGVSTSPITAWSCGRQDHHRSAVGVTGTVVAIFRFTQVGVTSSRFGSKKYYMITAGSRGWGKTSRRFPSPATKRSWTPSLNSKD